MSGVARGPAAATVVAAWRVGGAGAVRSRAALLRRRLVSCAAAAADAPWRVDSPATRRPALGRSCAPAHPPRTGRGAPSRGLLTDVLAAVAPGDASRVHTVDEERVINFPPEVVYSVIADVDNYSDFVPWCLDSRVLRRSTDGRRVEAELRVGFSMLTESYTSIVTLDPPYKVVAVAKDSSVFKSLRNEWVVLDGGSPDRTRLHFRVSFSFQSSIYSSFTNMFMADVVEQMVRAFSNRCALANRHSQSAGFDESPRSSVGKILTPDSTRATRPARATAPRAAVA
eukprot:CAMPEP_0203816872 /NCGR_PEP_ID=MMETSP0115-20131106/18199_1 /ASSEMBLY_ACC=CAM_ASM_000227 /TAXON_ID=33651 /ORGANISM="Bicosoecid sp, Strain ms1" /LENGTH=283 /DNA_ID=CAMNT_0050725783 /DNA_START=264 /DNA_END=1111 /DNA_ORIENTATION=-